MASVLVAAQCAVRAGDLEANLATHKVFMQHAAESGARLLVFPELSLTGYEPTLALDLAQTPESALFDPLRRLAREAGMTTVVGVPPRVPGRDKPQIAACILQADGALAFYTKQYLHGGEARFFSPGQGGELLPVGDQLVALSVCADFSHADHPARAAAGGARVYATSVLIGEGGYEHDSALLLGHAQRHGMAVLMANHGGPTGGWAAAGRSAFWDEQGHCVAQVGGAGNRLLIVAGQPRDWCGREVVLG